MTEQGTTKDQVSLDDLKRAIEKVERYKRAPLNEALHNAVGWCAAERDAWKAAFEWRERWHDRLDNASSSPEAAGLVIESLEGMDLIREKLG